jgi:precorrin-6B methylase 2
VNEPLPSIEEGVPAIEDERGMLARVLKPTPYHRSRIHTLRGTTMSPREWLDVPVQVGRRLAKRSTSAPWLSRSAIRNLERILRPGSRMVEVGAGSSTLWFAERVAELVSYEATTSWTERVRGQLDAAGVTNARVEAGSYEEIADAVRGLEDEAYDIVFVDDGDDAGPGPGRVDFVDLGRAKVKPGGYLVLDNSDRPFYRAVDELLAGWEVERCVGPTIWPLTVIETSFYRRPA